MSPSISLNEIIQLIIQLPRKDKFETLFLQVCGANLKKKIYRNSNIQNKSKNNSVNFLDPRSGIWIQKIFVILDSEIKSKKWKNTESKF